MRGWALSSSAPPVRRDNETASVARAKLPAMAYLPTGLYEQLVTEALLRDSAELRSCTASRVDESESADLLGEYVGRAVARVLADLPAEGRVERANDDSCRRWPKG